LQKQAKNEAYMKHIKKVKPLKISGKTGGGAGSGNGCIPKGDSP